MSEEEASGGGHRPSELDEATHREFLMMYNECASSIRYAKSKQWHSLSGALIFYGVLGWLGQNSDTTQLLYRLCLSLSVFVTVGTFYCLFIYQSWQNTERRKLQCIAHKFSSSFSDIRAMTSSTESIFHRYTLLCFMMIILILANWLLVLALHRPDY